MNFKSNFITLALRIEPDDTEKLITINKGDEVTLKIWKEIGIMYNMKLIQDGLQNDCLTYYNYEQMMEMENNPQLSKDQLTQDVGFSMLLN